MIRRLFTVASAVSLILCAATVALWVRSYPRLEGISRCWISHPESGKPRVRFLSVDSSRGLIQVLYAQGFQLDRSREPRWSVYSNGDEYLIRSGVLGFTYERSTGRERFVYVNFPHWAVCLTLIFAPLRLVRSQARLRRRRSRNLCIRCGYDLRATPDRCPECGHVRYEAGH